MIHKIQQLIHLTENSNRIPPFLKDKSPKKVNNDLTPIRIPEIKLKLVPSSQIKLGFQDASNEVGKRWKVGGKPDWIQNNETPICRDCGYNMTFYAQLDSLNDYFMIGDCGLIYVFYCFTCFDSECVFQEY